MKCTLVIMIIVLFFTFLIISLTKKKINFNINSNLNCIQNSIVLNSVESRCTRLFLFLLSLPSALWLRLPSKKLFLIYLTINFFHLPSYSFFPTCLAPHFSPIYPVIPFSICPAIHFLHIPSYYSFYLPMIHFLHLPCYSFFPICLALHFSPIYPVIPFSI